MTRRNVVYFEDKAEVTDFINRKLKQMGSTHPDIYFDGADLVDGRDHSTMIVQAMQWGKYGKSNPKKYTVGELIDFIGYRYCQGGVA